MTQHDTGISSSEDSSQSDSETKKSRKGGLLVLTGLGGAVAGAALLGLATIGEDDRDNLNDAIDDFQQAWLGQQPIAPVIVNSVPLEDTKSFDLTFATDEHLIDASQTPVIIDILADLNTDPNRTALVIGCADRVGGEAHNQELAQERAQIISNALVAAGVAPSRINTTSFGEECRIVGPDNQPNQGKRRVEVLTRDHT